MGGVPHGLERTAMTSATTPFKAGDGSMPFPVKCLQFVKLFIGCHSQFCCGFLVVVYLGFFLLLMFFEWFVFCLFRVSCF